MKKELVENFLNSVSNGTYINLSMSRSVETYKKLGDLNITKSTDCIIRLGVRRSNIQDAAVQARIAAKRAKGSTEDPNTLPWGHWVEGSKYLIEYNGKLYLRCAVSRSPKHHTKVTYRQNNQKVEYSEIEYALTANEKKSNKDVIFDVALDNIISLGKK